MTKSKKTILCIFLALLMFVPMLFMGGCTAEVYVPDEDTGYYIADYNVDIVVNKNRQLEIKESITAHFVTGPSNGIYRYIPLVQNIGYYNQKGKFVDRNYRSDITDVYYASDTISQMTTEEENGYLFLAMRRKGALVENEYTFTFGYTYCMPDDRDASMDIIYYNIIGTGWDTSIKNVDFSIEFPSGTSLSPDFYIGKFGEISSADSRLSVSISGNKVTGNCVNLDYGEAITFYNDFEDGYFNNPHLTLFDLEFFDWLFVVLFVVLAVAIFIVQIKHRKKEEIIEVVEFKAPEDIDPTQAGYIIDGTVTGEDVSALIVYWASKGFVKIEQQGKDESLITKICDLPEGAKKHQKLLFNELFKNGDSIFSSSLGSLDGTIGSKIKQSVENKEKLYFNTKARSLTMTMLLICMIVIGFSAFRMGSLMVDTFMSFIKILLVVVSYVASCYALVVFDNRYKYNRGKYISLLVLCLFFVLASLIINMVLGEGYVDPFGSRIWLSALPLIVLFVYPTLERHTKRGREEMGKLLGLRNFIVYAEKDRIEMLANDNPNVFFEILPYAYVLGVSEVYMERFKDIPISSPAMQSSGMTDVFIMCTVMNRNISLMGATFARKMPSSLQRISRTIASSSGGRSGGFSGGSGGGGGFSGGGFGGGGGGRF